MSMELLAGPYLATSTGGFYQGGEFHRDRAQHLEELVLFWPYMAVVDAFQHWAHTHEEGRDPAACDGKWTELSRRYMPAIDWSGLEDALATGWHHKQHIHSVPFYYVEYGLAQLGAVQVWRNALRNQAEAVAQYRRALSLGGTVTLPDLYKTAGARFAFDAATLKEAVSLIESSVEELNAG